MSSYPTYEEWKQLRTYKQVPDLDLEGSYPTYEEWKPLFSFTSTLRPSCSYPTYEEWKLLSETPHRINRFVVLILPMRNGNLL